MSRVLLISGWAQSADSLRMLVPEADILDYLTYSSMDDVEAHCKGKHYGIVIGWSLGGLIAFHLVSNKIIHAQKLILLATPYQFPDDSAFDVFKQGIETNIEKTLKRFQLLIAKGHIEPKAIIRQLGSHKNVSNLLYWLEQLILLSPKMMNLSSLPETILIQGDEDYIIPLDSMEMLSKELPLCQVVKVPDCGHAPHVAEPFLVKQYVNQMMSNNSE